MANGNQLPEGFVLDQQPSGGLPEGFVLDQQPPVTQQPPVEAGGMVSAIAEPAMAIGTAIPATIAAGLGGAVQAINPFAAEGAGAKTIEEIQKGMTYQPRTKAGEEGLKTVGELIKRGVDLVNYPISGLGALVELVSGQGIDQAAETLKQVQTQGPGKTAGQRVLEETGSPEAATVVETAISGAGELIGAKGAGKAVKVPTKPTAKIKQKFVPDEKFKAQRYESILKNLKEGKKKEAVIDAMPDKEIMKAADELGIDLNPDHYSSNQVFRETIQSLKNRPESGIRAKETKAIEDLGNRADDLIADLGGKTDKTLLDANVRNDFNANIHNLEKQADNAYKAVNDVIPKTVKVKPKASREYIDQTLKDVGGNTNVLTSAERALLQLRKKNPTYAELDRIRRDVGNGFRKKSGPYKDDDAGTLKQVYKALSKDQEGVANTFGMVDEYRTARKLVSTRKELEDHAVKLFGRDVGGSLIPKITQAGTALTKGDTSKFRSLMQSLPEARRGEVAATMLNDLFTQGARVKDKLGGGFVKAYDGLNRNRGAKQMLFDQLPEGAMRRFDLIGTVSKGIYRSKALENTSRTARDLVSAMDDGGLFGKVYDVGKRVTIAEGVTTGVGLPGVGAAGVIGAALAKGRTKASKAADDFVTSQRFKQAIQQSAAKGNPELADKILKGSPQYQAWKKQLNKKQAAQLGSLGFIAYVTQREEE